MVKLFAFFIIGILLMVTSITEIFDMTVSVMLLVIGWAMICIAMLKSYGGRL